MRLMQHSVAAALLLAMATTACGKYGPPDPHPPERPAAEQADEEEEETR